MLGSSAVARSYSDAGKKVKGVFHMDVVAFVKKGTERRIGVISDNVDEGLTALMRRLIGEFGECLLLGGCSAAAGRWEWERRGGRGKKLIRMALTAEIPAVDTKCGYACSDHVRPSSCLSLSLPRRASANPLPPPPLHATRTQSSWAHLSYPSACLSEGRYEDSNTHMHSAQDTIDLDEFEWDHVVQFVRVGLGYAVEVGGLKRV